MLPLTPPGMGVDKEGNPVCSDRFNVVNLIHSTFPDSKQCPVCAKPFDRVEIDTQLEGGSEEWSRQCLDKRLANQIDERGLSVLHKAVINAEKEIVELLIEKGAFINQLDPNDQTPLDRALSQWDFKKDDTSYAICKEEDIISLLISNKAETNKNKNMLENKKYREAVRKLLNKPNKILKKMMQGSRKKEFHY